MADDPNTPENEAWEEKPKPKGKKRSIKENLGRASKSSGIAPKKTNPQPIVESNQMVDRFKKLAGII